MKGLFLYGVNCTNDIWKNIKEGMSTYDITYAAYPHEITEQAKTPEDITKWVYETYRDHCFDFIVGHSLGGIIALQLAAIYHMTPGCIIFLDTNLKPANAFYRNLMTPEHMELYGTDVLNLMKEERGYYHPKMFEALQEEFDYTPYLKDIKCPIFGIYGDRDQPDYENRYTDLCLKESDFKDLRIRFIEHACHMPMVEQPERLVEIIKECLSETGR